MRSVSPDQIVSRRVGVETRPLRAGGAVLVDLNTGKCVRLNRVGAEVWALLERPAAVSTIHQQIRDRYGIPPEQAETDVIGLIDQLLREELVDRIEAAAAPAIR
jgi:hypothetical protein